MKKVVFFTEFSSSIGYGHISRCVALADELESRNFKIEFVIREAEFPPIIKFNYTLYNWEKSLQLENYDLKNTIFIFDTYRVDKKTLRKLAKNINYPISISDSQQNYIGKGLVIFTSAYGKQIVSTLKNINFDYLAGPDYVVFRSEILKTISEKRVTRQNVELIVVSLGAFLDSNNLLLILKNIKLVFPLSEIIVFGSVELTEEINRISGISYLNFVEIREYINTIQKADFAIVNGGQSLNEVLLMKVPSISIPVVENQKSNISYWLGKKACITCENVYSIDFDQDFKDKLLLIKEFKTREYLSIQEVGLDAIGPKRIVDFITLKI